MTDTKYLIRMYAPKRNETLKTRMYEGNAQGALAIMSAWILDAQTIANNIEDTVCVRVNGGCENFLSACSYVEPEVKQ